MATLHIVYNPVAGRGRARRALERVREGLERRGVDFRIHTTERPRHATELAAALPDGSRIAVLGGDGTVHEVALACIGSGRILAPLPQGSGDDFAFALGLDRRDLGTALERAVRGAARRVDSGRVAGTAFVNAFGSGFDAEVAARMQRAPQLLGGSAAYLWAVVRALGALEPVAATVAVDGRRVHRGPALLVAVQNGPRSGGSFPFAPDARLDDGRFDVVIAGAFGRLGALTVLPRVMRGAHLGHPRVAIHRGRRVAIRWERPRPAHLEGETLEPRARWEATLEPRSLWVVGSEDPPDTIPETP